MLQSQLKAIGVPVEIQQLDSAAVMKATTEGAFDLLLWRYDWNDPDALNIYLSSKRIRQTNRVFYSNKQVDALFERGLREFDPDEAGTDLPGGPEDHPDRGPLAAALLSRWREWCSATG